MKKISDNFQRIVQGSDFLEAEIVVIGSGPGGFPTACMLAEAGKDVLLVEEGAFLPQSSSKPFSLEEMETKYRNGGITFASGETKINYVEGCCVGGGSEINSGLYHRTPEDVLVRWSSEYMVRSLNSEILEHVFAENEKELNVCYLPGEAPKASAKLRAGASLLGWKSMEAPRAFRYDTPYQPDLPKGTRQSMTEIFLPRFIKAGGRLMPGSKVVKLKKNPGSAGWDVQSLFMFEKGLKRRITIRAKTVFAAAGSIQTPVLLRRSGIKHNIGNSLRFHPTIKVVAEFPEKVNSKEMGVPVHQVKEFAPKYSFGCSISSLPYISMALLDHPAEIGGIEKKWENMAAYYCMISGGKGIVRAFPFSSDALVRYRLDEPDLCSLSDGLRELCLLLLKAGAKALYPTIAGALVIRKKEDLMLIPRPLPADRTNLMTIHLMGSCPMGEDTAKCAVDSFGKVHGMEGLYINDASIFCDAVGVNPQGTIMALARRNVLNFLN